MPNLSLVSPVLAAVSLGSNQGDSPRILADAIADLAKYPEIRIKSQSQWFRTPPMGPPQPDYMNGCILIETEFAPEALLQVLQTVEQRYGRTRQIHWGPRTLDLDLLFYGDRVIQSQDLTVPHPGLPERAFVLVPLNQICADWPHPHLQATIAELTALLPVEAKEQVYPV